MNRRAEARILKTRPTARGVFKALAWSAVGPLACFAILVAIGVSLWNRPIEDQRRFDGVLRPVTAPLAVALPRHAILSQILVVEGDVVRSNQTLATLDLPLMTERLARLEVETAALQLEMQCLSTAEAPALLESVGTLLEERSRDALVPRFAASQDRAAADAGSRVLDDSVLSFTIAREECRLRNDVWSALQGQLDDRLVLLQEREKTLSTLLRLLVERNVGQAPEVAAQDPTNSDAYDALQALLARNQTAEDVLALEAEIAALALARDKARVEELESLAARARDLASEAEAVRRLIAEPRVLSPGPGVITRVRDPGKGHVARADLEVLQMARAGAQRFSLTINVPSDEIRNLTNGARVDISLAGGPESPPLGGTLALDRRPLGRRSEANAVVVSLDGPSRAWLASDRSPLALDDSSTSSTVTVDLGARHLGPLLRDTLWEALPKPAVSGPVATY